MSTPSRRSRWRLRMAGAPLLACALAALLAVAVLAALTALAMFDRREVLHNAQARAELIARTLEDHVTRTVESASLILQTLGESVAQQPADEPLRLQPLLDQRPLAGLPFLRGAAVLDAQGTVLASSIAVERGTRVDLHKLGPVPGGGGELLLPLVRGRSLADLAVGATAPRAAGVGMLPLVRALRAPDGQSLLLVALINPGSLANFQKSALDEPGSVAMLSGLDGRLVAANDPLPVEPGAVVRSHPVFESWLPDREHGEYIGPGTLPGQQVVAFRMSRRWPLVGVVELAEPLVLRSWYERLRWLGGIGVLALVAIAGGLLALLREMDARDRARSALQGAHDQVALRERELSVLLKSLQELIFRTDADGAITFVNERWAAVRDGDLERARGLRLPDLVVPADRQRAEALFRLDDRAGMRQAQLCVPLATGELRHFQVAVVPLYGRGCVVGFAGSAIDISDRVAFDQQLQHQLSLTALLLEISPLPVSMCDAHGRYVRVNQAWEDLLGRPRASLIGSSVGRSLALDDPALHAEQDVRLLATGGRQRYETRMRHRDGSCRDMVVTKVLVPEADGSPAGILCTLMDVSEFRDAERATREARDVAEQASRAKSEFVANISHELRTPLQAILGFSELGFTRGKDAPKLAGMFGDIHNAGRHMLALVNDLLDVAKIESVIGGIERQRCDLRGLVHAVLRELDPLLAQRDVRLSLSLPDTPLAAEVDPGRIHQALRNVVANAIKFSPRSAALQIEASRTPQDECLLSVADQGPGIPPGELESIFEAFVQSSQTKDGSGGTGLGLAICRKIVELHGGRVAAENRTDGGAVFHMHLPLAAAA